MICKSCGHPNHSTSIKCASCGTEMNNERVAMFQAQAQVSKGIDVTLAQEGSSQPVENPEDFFAEISGTQAKTPAPPPRAKSHFVDEQPKASFFSQVGMVEEPAFETEIAALRPEEKPKGPAEHPLYSPPTNPIIEGYIARRAAVRK